VQVKATANTGTGPSPWACQSITLVNTDLTRTYTFTATQLASPFKVFKQAVNAANNPVVLTIGGAFKFGAPSLNDDGSMGKPSWPNGWTIGGNWV